MYLYSGESYPLPPPSRLSASQVERSMLDADGCIVVEAHLKNINLVLFPQLETISLTAKRHLGVSSVLLFQSYFKHMFMDLVFPSST